MTNNKHTLDALTVVAGILGRRPDLAAVHAISTHGNNGRKGLINIKVNAGDLPAWADELGDADWAKSTHPADMHPGAVYTIHDTHDGTTSTVTGPLEWSREWSDGWEIQLNGYLLSLDHHGEWTIETH